MRILITGANGFIGGYLVPHLQSLFPKADILPVGLGNSSLPKFQSCDFTDSAAVSKLVSSYKPTHTYHLIGIARVREELGVPEYFKMNFLTTRYLADALVRLGSSRLFFTSSVHLYGNQSEVVTESSPVHPGSAYAFTKYLAERMLHHYTVQHPGFQVTVGRLYSCFGPGQPPGFVTADFCRRILELKKTGKDTLEVGPLSPIRRFLDVRDLVEVMPRLLDGKPQSRFEIFNIASPHERTIGQLLTALLQIAGTQPKIRSSDQSANPFKGLGLSLEKLNHALPQLRFRPVEETLRDMWQELAG